MEQKLKKYQYYRVFFRITPEVDKKFGKFATYYAKDIIQEVVNNFDEIKKVPIEVADNYYDNTEKSIGVYVSKDIYKKWKSIPRQFKKQAQYLINQKLLEMEI
jgi:hypothetical protein